MTLFGWIFVAFCWSLPFALWAIRRWRIRMYVQRGNSMPPAKPFVVPRPKPFLVNFEQQENGALDDRWGKVPRRNFLRPK